MYNKCLKINPNEKDTFNNLINLLTFHNPQEKDLNFIIKTNSLLKMNKFIFDEKKQINDEQIVNYFQTSNNIVIKNLNKNDYNYTEIFRKNTYNLNFKRQIQKLSNSYMLVLVPRKTHCKPTKLKTSQFSIHQ